MGEEYNEPPRATLKSNFSHFCGNKSTESNDVLDFKTNISFSKVSAKNGKQENIEQAVRKKI